MTRNLAPPFSTPKMKKEESDLATKTFEKLVDAFISDYTLKKIVVEKCGWRTAYEISQETGGLYRNTTPSTEMSGRLSKRASRRVSSRCDTSPESEDGEVR
jgi:hypothetical protein